MENFNVVLVNPNDNMIAVENFLMYENLGLALLASVLRKEGIRTTIIDAYAYDLGVDETVESILKESPSFIGFTCTYQSFPNVIEISNKIKNINDDIHISIGGEHATFTSKEILKHYNSIDSVIRGEGEDSILELVKAIYNKSSIDNIKGIHFQKNGVIHCNADRIAINDLDTIPYASRDTLMESMKLKKTILIGMIASRGCYSSCYFCNANKYFRLGGGKVLRRRSPENIVKEMLYLKENFVDKGADLRMQFYDATFVTPDKIGKKWALDIAEGLIRNNIKIPYDIFARADSFTEEDENLILKLKESGLVSAFVGFESNTDTILSA